MDYTGCACTRTAIKDEGAYITTAGSDIIRDVFQLLDPILPTDDAMDIAMRAFHAWIDRGVGAPCCGKHFPTEQEEAP